MSKSHTPDSTAVRTALWRALHLQIDAKPYVIEDEVGLSLVAPEAGWQNRPDMKYTARLRASILARARFIEDLVIKEQKNGASQYVILGAGLDTFAQRRKAIASNLQIYEIDEPGTLSWKRDRLEQTGIGVPEYLHFVPVDFEENAWWDALLAAGFSIEQSTLVVCTGVTLYLSEEAILTTLQQLTALAPGSSLAVTFYLPMELLDDIDKPMQEIAEKGAREAGTPFVSFFTPEEILALAGKAGLENVRIRSTQDMESLYFKGRADGLVPASGELFLLADI